MKYLTIRHADTGALREAWYSGDVAPDEFDDPAQAAAAMLTIADGGPRVVGDCRIALESMGSLDYEWVTCPHCGQRVWLDFEDDSGPADGFPPRNFDPFGL